MPETVPNHPCFITARLVIGLVRITSIAGMPVERFFPLSRNFDRIARQFPAMCEV